MVTYRLAATWLPSVVGLIALELFRRRHRDDDASRRPAQPCVDV